MSTYTKHLEIVQHIRFNERFYLRENTGRALEDAARKGRIEAIVRVWRGMPVIVSLDVSPGV